jgi:hypothetical protein
MSDVRGNKRLQWVARNRTRRDVVVRAGELVAHAVRSAGRSDAAVVALLSEQLGGVVDESFRRHCRAVAVRGGRLIIGVDAPSMVSLMQARWRSRLQAAIRALAPRSGARDVSFEFGLTGSEFQTATTRALKPGAADESPAYPAADTIYG